MPAIIMMNQAAPTPNPEKKPKKRVITEARKIQNREAQRAYRLRQKERLRALKEAHEQDSRSSSAYHELRPQPPVGKWTDAYIPIPPPSWTFPIQGVGVVEGDSQSEIISPLANGQPQDLNLTAAAAAVNLNLNLNLNLTADPLSVPLPGSNLATPDGSIGDGSIGVPEPQSFPGLVDMDSMEGPTTEIDPLLTGLKFFPQSGSDLDSHVSSIDGFLGHVDESLLLSFQHDGSGSSSSSSNIHADANYSLNNPPIPHSSSDVPSVPTLPKPQPAPSASSHHSEQTSTSPFANATATPPRPAKSTSRPATKRQHQPRALPKHTPEPPTTNPTQSATKPKPNNPSPPATDTLPSLRSNHLTPLATFFLTGTMQNATALGMSVDQFFSMNCMSLESPFYQPVASAAIDPKSLLGAVIARNPFIPTHLRPTLPQILIQHHPLFDLIPLAGLRSRAIIMSATMPGLVDMVELKKDIIQGGLVCKGVRREVFDNGGTGQPWDLRSWEVARWFWEKWRILLDGEGEGGGDLWE